MGGSSGGSGGAASDMNKLAQQNAPIASNLTKGMPGQNLGQQYLPQFQQGANQLAHLTGSPAAQYLMGGANRGAQYGQQAAAQGSQFSHQMMPYAQNLMSYGKGLEGRANNLFAHEQPLFQSGNRIAEMGFDPQNALYSRTLQQVQDQQRAGQAARGISMSPYGAGLEGDATRNFNIDWQNQQLARAAQAGQAQAGLYGAAGNLGQQGAGIAQTGAGIEQTGAGLGSTAFNLGSGASDLAASASRLPYQARQGLIQDKTNAYAGVAPNVMGANAPRQQVISDFLSSIGMAPPFTQAAASSQNAGTAQTTGISKIFTSLIGK